MNTVRGGTRISVVGLVFAAVFGAAVLSAKAIPPPPDETNEVEETTNSLPDMSWGAMDPMWAETGTNVLSVTNFNELAWFVDYYWTNSPMCALMPPGVDYSTSIGVMAYTNGFDTNFLSMLVGTSNGTFYTYAVSVTESNETPRQRYYWNSTGGLIRTVSPTTGYNPGQWISNVFGASPSYLSGSALTNWLAERDPRRQHAMFQLIHATNVASYQASVTSALDRAYQFMTNSYLYPDFSNKLAMVNIDGWDNETRLYVHAPTSVTKFDIYECTNLLCLPYDWTILTTVNHTTDPLFLRTGTATATRFYSAGNAALDTDNDGISDSRENILFGSRADLRDSDGDGISDWDEIMNAGSDPNGVDSDGDGLTDLEELALGTNPTNPDTDGDGLTDYQEVRTYYFRVDPLNADTDGDGLSDHAEIITYGTYPGPYCSEAQDSDRDGILDYSETSAAYNPMSIDTDGDGMYDYFETFYGLNPLSSDATQDADSDGFNNITEYQWKTDPTEYYTNYPYTQSLICKGPGSNEYRRVDSPHNILAVNDIGDASSAITVRPYRQGSILVPQRLHHSQARGIYINGTEAYSLSTPIEIPAASTAITFRITAANTNFGTNLYVYITDTNNTYHGGAYFYIPELWKVGFYFLNTVVDVYRGNTGNMVIGMPSNTNACRIHMYPYQTPDHYYLSPYSKYFYRNERVLVKVTGSGASPQTSTLNELDYNSAFAYAPCPSPDIHNRGIHLEPGAYVFEVGFDMNLNGTLESSEVQETCNIMVVSTDVSTDSNNDGSISSSDDPIENLLPGKVVFGDKDAYWRDHVTNSTVAEVRLSLGNGNNVVPTNCAVILEWLDCLGALSYVQLFEDSARTIPVTNTPYQAPYYGLCAFGHVYGPGDTVPSNIYVSATAHGLYPDDDTKRTVLDDTISLVCYRMDTTQQVCGDDIKITIANTPAVSPKNGNCYMWEEDYTLSWTHSYASNFWSAIKNDSVGDGVHVPPYAEEYYTTAGSNRTPQTFADLSQAGIVMTLMHGASCGEVYPMAFPPTGEGETNAQSWAVALGTNYAYKWLDPPPPNGKDCWFVCVKTTYFESQWKPTRDANNAMLFAVTCFAGTNCPWLSLPSFIDAAGGKFGVGHISSNTPGILTAAATNIVSDMRGDKWRTAAGSFLSTNLYEQGFRMAGDGKVTLWPAPLKGSYQAIYPQSHATNGTVIALFDTSCQSSSQPLVKMSGDGDFSAGNPQWMTCNSTNCMVRWPYTKDTSSSVMTRIKAVSSECKSADTTAGQLPKNLAGDGKSCGRNLEWEY